MGTGLLPLGAGLLIAWCLVCATRSVHEAGTREVDPVAALEANFEALVPHLPAAGVIGYLKRTGPDTPDALREYYVAQYTLAPRVVVLGLEPEFLIVPAGSAAQADEARRAGFFPVAAGVHGHRVYRRLHP